MTQNTPCHPRCTLGPDRDHPGYLEYRCIDEDVNALPFPGESEARMTQDTPQTAREGTQDATTGVDVPVGGSEAREALVGRIAEAIFETEHGTFSEDYNPDHNRWTWQGDGHHEVYREGFRTYARAVLPLVDAEVAAKTESLRAEVAHWKADAKREFDLGCDWMERAEAAERELFDLRAVHEEELFTYDRLSRQSGELRAKVRRVEAFADALAQMSENLRALAPAEAGEPPQRYTKSHVSPTAGAPRKVSNVVTSGGGSAIPAEAGEPEGGGA